MSYLDTSIIVPAYCPEVLSDLVAEVLLRETRLVISSLVEVEFFSALSRKIRQHELTLAEGRRCAEIFRSDLNTGIYTRLSVEAVHYQMARHWLSQFDTTLRTLDALHLAIAVNHGLKLITADTGLAGSAQAYGLGVELLTC